MLDAVVYFDPPIIHSVLRKGKLKFTYFLRKFLRKTAYQRSLSTRLIVENFHCPYQIDSFVSLRLLNNRWIEMHCSVMQTILHALVYFDPPNFIL